MARTQAALFLSRIMEMEGATELDYRQAVLEKPPCSAADAPRSCSAGQQAMRVSWPRSGPISAIVRWPFEPTGPVDPARVAGARSTRRQQAPTDAPVQGRGPRRRSRSGLGGADRSPFTVAGADVTGARDEEVGRAWRIPSTCGVRTAGRVVLGSPAGRVLRRSGSSRAGWCPRRPTCGEYRIEAYGRRCAVSALDDPVSPGTRRSSRTAWGWRAGAPRVLEGAPRLTSRPRSCPRRWTAASRCCARRWTGS